MHKKPKTASRERSRTVFVGMSGGVDSSVAAALLKREGYNVVGVHLRSYNVDGCGEQDAEDARRAAETLQIPFYVFDVEREYRAQVVEYMVQGYKAGITPNPDVMCNKEIKFGVFLKKALALGADYIATGHYVRKVISNSKLVIRKNNNQDPSKLPITNPSERIFVRADYQLLVAKDGNKDQSYFLWTLTQAQLAHCLFPIGDYLKSEVRAMARKFGLSNAEKKDSQGICFLGQVTLADFLKEYIQAKPGLVMTRTGEKVGEHQGASLYTIGQRHGFTVARSKNQEVRSKDNNTTKPQYVIEKNVKTNTLVVAEENDPSLFKKEVNLGNINIITSLHSPIRANRRMKVLVRVRYRQPLVKATLQLINSLIPTQGRDPDFVSKFQSNVGTHQLKFDSPIKFVAPGQSAVFYVPAEASAKEGKKTLEMLGGGVIQSAP